MKSRSVSFMLAICKWCALMLFQGLWCAVDFEEERWRLYELVLFPSLPGLPICTASAGILVQCSSWQLTDCPVEPSFCVFICHKVTLDLQMLGLPPAPSPTPQEKERKKKKDERGKTTRWFIWLHAYCKILQLPVFISTLKLLSPKAP